MSIILKLENIHCYTSAQFNLDRDKLTLIKGNSGVGKSTIFQAITHALYGKVKNICNFNANKYMITLSISEFTIQRQNKSPHLRLWEQDKLYEDEVAQNIINRFFGTEDIWYTTCYIEQD